jgi:hypothetical protein
LNDALRGNLSAASTDLGRIAMNTIGKVTDEIILVYPRYPAPAIQLAPPAVDLVACLSVTDLDPGLFARILLG